LGPSRHGLLDLKSHPLEATAKYRRQTIRVTDNLSGCVGACTAPVSKGEWASFSSDNPVTTLFKL
jgi:hypothetical protein